MWRSKMKYRAIHTNLEVNVIVISFQTWNRDSQGHKIFWASPGDKQTQKYHKECSNHHPSLLAVRTKDFSCIKMKWSVIYPNVAAKTLVRVRQYSSGDSHGQEQVLAPSAENQTYNYDTEYSNHHPSLSTVRPKGLSCSKMKW